MWGWGQRFYVEPVLFVVILVALLLTPPGRGLPRAHRAVELACGPRAASRCPRAARRPEVRSCAVGTVGVVVGVLLLLPAVLSNSDVNLAAVMVIYAVIALSLVVLTGWAGEVSLGQMAFVAIGAAAAGSITTRLGWDLGLGAPRRRAGGRRGRGAGRSAGAAATRPHASR